jgi:Flp pilus assembly protein TadD
MDAGDYAAAVPLFEVVTRAVPDGPAPWSNLCKAIGMAKDPRWRDEGLRACDKAVKLNPRDGNLHHVIGHIQKETDPEAAALSFRRAVELNPKDAPSYNALGMVLHRLKDGPGAIDAARKAAAIEPHIKRMVFLGQMLAIHGECAEAEQVAARARAMGDASLLDGTMKKWCGS